MARQGRQGQNDDDVQFPGPRHEKAKVNVKTEIENNSNSTASVKLKTIILSPKGKKVASFISSRNLDAGALAVFNQTSPVLLNPMLWDTEHPDLYTAVSIVYINGKKQDEFHTDFGIRSVKWTADKGFFLNGKHARRRGRRRRQQRGARQAPAQLHG